MRFRLRADHPEFELRNAQVRVCRKARLCDAHGCFEPGPRVRTVTRIEEGDEYAWLSHGIALCGKHWSRDDMERYEIDPPSTVSP